MIKDECGLVHLAQDEQHLVVDELFVVLQLALHVLLQLCADLKQWQRSSDFLDKPLMRGSVLHYFVCLITL